jgi:hypothetical protein
LVAAMPPPGACDKLVDAATLEEAVGTLRAALDRKVQPEGLCLQKERCPPPPTPPPPELYFAVLICADNPTAS